MTEVYRPGGWEYLVLSNPLWIIALVAIPTSTVDEVLIYSECPGVGLCEEDGKVIYNDTFGSVTLYVDGGPEMTYGSNYVTKHQVAQDLGVVERCVYIAGETEGTDYLQVHNGFVFLKPSNGKRFEVSDMT